jgi:alkylhydroperoxidase family enzyme
MSRIAPLSPPYPSEIQAQFEVIMRGAPPLTLFRVLAAHPRAWEKFRAGALLDRGPLSMHEREIVINRTCALNRCEYEWGVHVAVFGDAARLTTEQIAATVSGTPSSSCWSAAEKALVSAVDALHSRSDLSGKEFAALVAHYDSGEILEILMLCGFYRTVSYLCNALKLPLEPTAARFNDAVGGVT